MASSMRWIIGYFDVATLFRLTDPLDQPFADISQGDDLPSILEPSLSLSLRCGQDIDKNDRLVNARDVEGILVVLEVRLRRLFPQAL